MFWILLAVIGCERAADPPQSRHLESSGGGGGRVDMSIDLEGPKPIALTKLRKLWPALDVLDDAQQRTASTAVNITPSPCIECGSLPIAHCLASGKSADCAALSKLLARTIRLTVEGRPSGQIKASINYPDLWIPGLGEGTPVQIHLFRDRNGPFSKETKATLGGLNLRFGTEIAVTISEAEIVPAPGLGVRARPTWFINGHRFRGAQSENTLARFVAFELMDVKK